MSDSTQSTPSTPSPSDSTGWNESAGFRETLLQHFTQVEDAAALRHVSEMLHEFALHFAQYWPKVPGYGVQNEVRAVAADLRHLEGYLGMLGREREQSALTAAESALSVLAERMAAEVGRIAGELERAAK